MSRGKKVLPDFIPAGASTPNTGEPSNEYMSATDLGLDFTTQTITVPENPSAQ